MSKQNNIQKVILHKDITPLGTGFLFLYKGNYVLVTARHLIEKDQRIRRKLIYMFHEFSTKNTFVTDFVDLDIVQKQTGSKWHFHQKDELLETGERLIDLAITIARMPPKRPDVGILTKSGLIPFEDVNLGSDIYYLGYPMSLISQLDVTPIIKKGIVAKKIPHLTPYYKDVINEKDLIKTLPEKTILVDGYFDEGNSGSPIIRGPQMIYNPLDTNKLRFIPEGLIGIATSHFTFKRHNIGLGIAISIDYIIEILESDEMKGYFKVEK